MDHGLCDGLLILLPFKGTERGRAEVIFGLPELTLFLFCLYLTTVAEFTNGLAEFMNLLCGCIRKKKKTVSNSNLQMRN